MTAQVKVTRGGQETEGLASSGLGRKKAETPIHSERLKSDAPADAGTRRRASLARPARVKQRASRQRGQAGAAD